MDTEDFDLSLYEGEVPFDIRTDCSVLKRPRVDFIPPHQISFEDERTRPGLHTLREKLTKGKQKIPIEFITDRNRRYSTFSKRKTGMMKKAVELAELTGAEVLLLIASETNHVYTYATKRLRGIVDLNCGKELIKTCLSNEIPNDSSPPVMVSSGQSIGSENHIESDSDNNIPESISNPAHTYSELPVAATTEQTSPIPFTTTCFPSRSQSIPAAPLDQNSLPDRHIQNAPIVPDLIAAPVGSDQLRLEVNPTNACSSNTLVPTTGPNMSHQLITDEGNPHTTLIYSLITSCMVGIQQHQEQLQQQQKQIEQQQQQMHHQQQQYILLPPLTNSSATPMIISPSPTTVVTPLIGSSSSASPVQQALPLIAHTKTEINQPQSISLIEKSPPPTQLMIRSDTTRRTLLPRR